MLRHPTVTRQASVAVMETAMARTETEVRPPQMVAPPPSHSILKTAGTSRPPSSREYRSDPEGGKNVFSSKTIKPPKPINLKDVLNLSPMPSDANNGIFGGGADLLPPSPSLAYSHFRRPSRSPQSETSFSKADPSSHTPPVPSQLSRAVNPLPKSSNDATSLLLGPRPIPPSLESLDYQKLMDIDDMNATLSKTVDDLCRWLKVVEWDLTSLTRHVDGDDDPQAPVGKMMTIEEGDQSGEGTS
ncbi:uncharacterized protein EI90DRAFT_692746 [Cantharellus anzutake]|uniref:uncharacterized protein n=1 Tax=Cantharellus anzutake TaxID=1750568 RepID=UPI0019041B8A|nr:uncharacterized protein EI90DRAFT_692746 [Cantharellus anzutake]KAF8332714.1 hypothetical protein EI90DRAFT_692746 [Cantharellus anzutake]